MGVIGVDDVACFQTDYYASEYAYKMFDGGIDSSHMACVNPSKYNHGIMGYYTKNRTKVKHFYVINDTYTSGSYKLNSGYIQGSNNTTNGIDGTWDDLAYYSITNTAAGARWSIDLSDNNMYYYAYRFYMDTGYNYQRIGELEVEAYELGAPLPIEHAWAAPSHSKYFIKY